MGISVRMPDKSTVSGKRLPAGRREAFKLKALRDFTVSVSRARNFDESLHLALMVVLGTCSIVKGAMFLEEGGEFRMKVSRGLPPGVPPVEMTRELAAALRRSARPIPARRQAASAPLRKAVEGIEKAVPAFRVEHVCPLGTRNGSMGILVLGPTLTGEALTPLKRETLGVMTSILSSHIANHRVLADVSRLNEVLRGQVAENERLLGEMQEIFLDTIRALAMAIEAKDPYTRGHSDRVAKISVSIARGLGLPEDEVEAINIASILHDVGKIGMPQSILTKPMPLTPDEFHEMRKHPRTSFDILSEIRFPYPNVANLAKDHHERLDGSGYPEGKRAGQIPMGARIIALADAFDAMVSDRPYRDSLPLLHALREIRSCLNLHYDAAVGKVFFRTLRREIAGENGEAPVYQAFARRCSGEEAIDFIDGALKDLN